jgi:nicotinamide mononucleotide adenylyltransferase
MVKNTLVEQGIPFNEYDIIPFPINFPEYIKYYVPLESTFYITIYGDWGRAKQRILQEELGVTVEVLEEGPFELKKAEGTKIRKLMKTEDDWQRFVPPAVRKYIQENNLTEKVV